MRNLTPSESELTSQVPGTSTELPSYFLTTDRLLVIVLFVLIFAMAVRPPADNDTWWHLSSGQYILENGIPFHDPFSHTVFGKGWIDHGWLAQSGLYLLYANFGYAGLGLALALAVTLTMGFVFLQSEVNLYLRAFVTILAAITSAVIWIARPQTISFVLAGAFCLILYGYKYRGRNYLFLIPVLFVLWVNVHGGFIVGFLILGGYIAGEFLNNVLGGGGEREGKHVLGYRQILTLIGVTALSLLACLINPNTYKMLTYPFFTVGIGALRDYIQEWAAPDFHLLHFHPFIWMLLLTLAALGLSARRADFTDLILVSGFCYMSLWAGRNVALFALVAAPVLSRHGAVVIDRLRESLYAPGTGQGALAGMLNKKFAPSPLLSVVNWVLLVVIVLGCGVRIYYPLTVQANLQAQEEFLPLGAVDFIEDHQDSLPGEMFNSYNWGGYLIWRLYPRYRVFIDGRTDIYDDAFVREYLQVVWARPGWQKVLDDYKVNFILVESDGLLATFLAENGDWRLAYQDEMAVIFVREGAFVQAGQAERRK